MNPKIVHSQPRRKDRDASGFTSGRSSHLSEVTTHEDLQAETDFETVIDSPLPAAVVHAERIPIPASPKLGIAQDAPSVDAAPRRWRVGYP